MLNPNTLPTACNRGPNQQVLSIAQYKGRWWLWIPLVLGIPVGSLAGNGIRFGEGAVGPHDVAIGLYSSNRPQPVAVLRVKRVFEDYQRKGFFRIGALPVLALEGVTVEIRDSVLFPGVLGKANDELALTSGTRRVIDGRGFTMCFVSQTNCWVRAKRLRLGNGGIWQLEDGTVALPDEPVRSFRRANLQMTGPHNGELNCEAPQGKFSIRLPTILSTVRIPPVSL